MSDVATAKLRNALAGIEGERKRWAERAERIEALQRGDRLDSLSSRHEEREYAEGVQFGLDMAARLLAEVTGTLAYVGEQVDQRLPYEPPHKVRGDGEQ